MATEEKHKSRLQADSAHIRGRHQRLGAELMVGVYEVSLNRPNRKVMANMEVQTSAGQKPEAVVAAE
jgi:hypothetical protein